MTSQKKRKRGCGVHCVDERQHQGQGCGPAQPWEDPYGEAYSDSHHHKDERIIPGR